MARSDTSNDARREYGDCGGRPVPPPVHDRVDIAVTMFCGGAATVVIVGVLLAIARAWLVTP